MGTAFPKFVISFGSSPGNCVGFASVNCTDCVWVMAGGPADVTLLLIEAVVFRPFVVGPYSVLGAPT